MSCHLIELNEDLKRLRNEGYEISVCNAHAVINHIPYVNSKSEVELGTLAIPLELNADKTSKPRNHVIHFHGDYPCNKFGSPIEGIRHRSGAKVLTGDITVNHAFSNQPKTGFDDYYHLFTHYIGLISAPAMSLDENITAKTFKVIESSSESVFNYHDTNSSRAEIDAISAKLQNQKVGVIGIGGTGSYILDFVSKTPVKEIHIFDGDTFLQHNAFRAPGAPPKEKFDEYQKKSAYFCDIYSRMHKGIVSHSDHITGQNINSLLDLDFIFICIDNGEAKKMIVEHLIKSEKSFIDVGIGVDIRDDMLAGIVRITTSTPFKRDHIKKYIPFIDSVDEAYSTNIQISELNALNAALAVIKWKKLFGFYLDEDQEHHTTYTIDGGNIANDETRT